MVTTSINKRLCQHRPTVYTDDESAIQSTIVWLRRRHLAFAVANGVLNRRFSAATVGCCGDGWKLRWVAGEAHNMTENDLSIWIVIFSVHLQQTKISERKLFIFHLGLGPYHRNSSMVNWPLQRIFIAIFNILSFTEHIQRFPMEIMNLGVITEIFISEVSVFSNLTSNIPIFKSWWRECSHW